LLCSRLFLYEIIVHNACCAQKQKIPEILKEEVDKAIKIGDESYWEVSSFFFKFCNDDSEMKRKSNTIMVR
jgi:hypothetical protein